MQVAAEFSDAGAQRSNPCVLLAVDLLYSVQFCLLRDQFPLQGGDRLDHCFGLLGQIDSRVFAGKLPERRPRLLPFLTHNGEALLQKFAFAARRRGVQLGHQVV